MTQRREDKRQAQPARCQQRTERKRLATHEDVVHQARTGNGGLQLRRQQRAHRRRRRAEGQVVEGGEHPQTGARSSAPRPEGANAPAVDGIDAVFRALALDQQSKPLAAVAGDERDHIGGEPVTDLQQQPPGELLRPANGGKEAEAH